MHLKVFVFTWLFLMRKEQRKNEGFHVSHQININRLSHLCTHLLARETTLCFTVNSLQALWLCKAVNLSVTVVSWQVYRVCTSLTLTFCFVFSVRPGDLGKWDGMSSESGHGQNKQEGNRNFWLKS